MNSRLCFLEGDIPEDYKQKAEEMRQIMVEKNCELDDVLWKNILTAMIFRKMNLKPSQKGVLELKAIRFW
jgi:hypothetical protein